MHDVSDLGFSQRPTARRSLGVSRAWLPVLCLAVLLLDTLPAAVAAQERIEAVRLGRHPSYVRIVLDVTADVDAYVSSEPAWLQVDAAPPALARETRRQLEEIGVRIERSSGGARIRLDVEPGFSWSAFRTLGGAPRIVLDVGREPPALPRDAAALQEVSGRDVVDPVETARRSTSRPPDAKPRIEAPDPSRALDTGRLRVRVQGIEFVGLPASGPSRDELLDLTLMLTRAPEGHWTGAAGESDARRMRLREVVSSQVLTSSVLQQIVERIAAVYADRQLMGTRVDIRRNDLEAVLASPGPLTIHVSEPAGFDR